MTATFGFVFPGQGSQSVGMLADVAAQFPELKKTFSEASDALGYDLWQLASSGPAEKLDDTAHAQPAILTASVAVWRLWHGRNQQLPSVLAGHSLGEYSALVCADSLDFSEAVQLVAERGRLMQAAVPAGTGAMAAVIGLADDDVVSLCEQATAHFSDQAYSVTAANFNSPGQVVIAGHTDAVLHAMALAKTKGARMVKQLAVSVPSHCALMQPAAEKFVETLQKVNVRSPQVAVINNVDVAAATEPDAIRDALVRQLYSPVRWVETVQHIANTGVKTIYECGPGNVLTGLNKRIDKTLEYDVLATVPELDTNSREVS